MTTPHIPQTPAKSSALRAALGPGLQFAGVTEQLLREVSRRG